MEVWCRAGCSKCRAAAQRFETAGIDFGIRRYLEEPPTAGELDEVLRRLGQQPWEIARLGEPVAKELGLADWPRDEARWIEAMVANPTLIQRPIVLLDDGRALVGRTPRLWTKRSRPRPGRRAAPRPTDRRVDRPSRAPSRHAAG